MGTEAQKGLEVPKARGLTPRVLLVGIIITILWTAPLLGYNKGPSPLGIRYLLRVLSFFGAQYVVFLLVILLTSGLASLPGLRGLRFTPQEYAVLYAMIWTLVPLPFSTGLATYSFLLSTLQAQYKGAWPAVPSIWVPKQLETQLWDGGLPLSDLLPTALMFTMVWYALFAFGFSIALLLKEQFLEVERLEYPLARPASQLISWSTAPAAERPWLFTRRGLLFWIPFIIGLFTNWYGPPILDIFPQTREIASKISEYVSWSEVYSGKFGPPFTNILLAPNVDLLGIAYYILFPVDILLTGIVAYVIFWILLPIVYVASGAMTPLTGQTEWPVYGTVGWQPPIMPVVLLDWSIWPGIAILVIIMARKHIANTLKAAMRGAKSEKLPVSYKTLWIALVGSGLVLVAFLSTATHPVLAIWTVAMIGITYLYMLRVRGDVWPGFGAGNWGPWTGGGDYISNSIVDLAVALRVLPGYGVPATPEQVQQLFASKGFLDAIGQHWYAQWFPGISCIEAVKIGEEHKTDLKEILIAQTIIAAIALPLVFTFLAYDITANGVKTYVGDWWAGHQLVWPASQFSGYLTSGASVWGGDKAAWAFANLILGIILVLAMGWARMRFAWFPFNPIGLPIFSVSFYAFAYGVIAFAIKYLVLKIWGAKFWEEKAFPVFAGLFIGGFAGAFTIKGMARIIAALAGMPGV